jgi:hypothetical protein
MNISELTRMGERDSYGNLNVDFAEAIAVAYPEVAIKVSEPGCFGHSGNIALQDKRLSVPGGKYASAKHFHTAGCGVVAVESSRKKHNLSGCPLYLLRGYAYNGDYKNLQKTYWIFGRNEDGSFFLHKIRPCVGETADLDAVRRWMWSLKGKEELAARQGDLGFIAKTRPAGQIDLVFQAVQIGNHLVFSDVVYRTKNRIYVINPRAEHGEHHIVKMQGVYELRLARQWLLGFGD